MEKSYNRKIDYFFQELDRSKFMDINKEKADIDCALPIGFGQTISEPSLVLQMTKLLKIKEDSTILEIGTGSGYQTAFLAEFGKKVYSVECIKELHNSAKKRLNEMGYDNITFIYGDGSVGCKEYAPYDRIIVTAAASTIPEEMLEQLSPEGVLVIPVGDQFSQELLQLTKDIEEKIEINRIELVQFVPLVGKYSIDK
jgi:protein-L-isoaspartate(D-aspartate) O-methyltransferase